MAVPFYRLYKPSSGDHFYTASLDECQRAQRELGYYHEGNVGNLYLAPAAGTVPLFRLWNGRDHFYTVSQSEASGCGYTLEAICGYVYPGPVPGSVPLMRHYNNRDHFYTTNSGETAKGYVFERITCYMLA